MPPPRVTSSISFTLSPGGKDWLFGVIDREAAEVRARRCGVVLLAFSPERKYTNSEKARPLPLASDEVLMLLQAF